MSPFKFPLASSSVADEETGSSRLSEEAKRKTLDSDSARPKPCCACPETKRVRDDCFLRYGPPDESSESAIKCADLITAHRACMAQYGFQI